MINKFLSSARFLWLLSLVALGTFTLQQSSVQFDLLALLPNSKTEELTPVKSFMDDAGFSKQVVILLGHKDQEIAKRALQTLRTSLQETDLPLRENDLQKTHKDFKQFFQKLFPHRTSLLSQEDRHLLQKNQGHLIVERALREITSPFGTLGPAHLNEDPFFLFPRYVLSLHQQNSFDIDPEIDAPFIKDQGTFWYLYHGQLDQSFFSLKLQENISNTLTPILQNLKVYILKTGAIFYAAAGAQQAKNEMSTMGSVSAALIILLLLVIFRSLRPLGFALLVMTSALVGGVSLTFLVFQSIHILALVFGASLIGVCVDYALHYYCAYLHTQNTTNFAVLKSLLPALPLGVLSSCIGYGLLTFVPFPGIQQMALLAATGLLTAFITVALWGPILLKTPPKIPPLFAQKAQGLLERFASLSFNKTALTLSVLMLSSVGLYTLSFDDDVRHFQSLNQDLKAQEKQLQVKMSLTQSPTFFTLTAPNLEHLLQQEEKIIEQLEKLNISSQSLSSIIPSQKRQMENHHLIQEKLIEPHLNNFLKTLGMTKKDPAENKPDLIDYIPDLPQAWRILMKKKSTGLESRILIQNVENSAPLYKIAKQYTGVTYNDPPQKYSALFSEYRILMIKMILAVLAIIILVLTLLKGPKAALKITTPVIFSLLLTLSFLSFASISLTLFHIMGLLLVLCIGIDYALFLYWRKNASNAKDFFLLANAMAALTTLFSFGMLALSTTAAVQGFGVTVFIGITLSFLMTTLYLGKK